MMNADEAARSQIIARLAESREELQQILDPPPRAGGPEGEVHDSQFPRSRTMRALMSGQGLGALGALAGGLLLAKPGLALRLLRMVPVSSLAKMFAARAMTSLRSKRQSNQP
jgi:hypothetical protein